MFSQMIPLIVGTHVVLAAAGRPPAVDIAGTCREADKTITALFGDKTQVNFGSCMDQERAALDQLAKDWATFPDVDRAHCVDPKQYMPSYVEWLTCFEMEKGVRTIRQNSPARQN